MNFGKLGELSVRLLKGDWFSKNEIKERSSVALVNAAFMSRYASSKGLGHTIYLKLQDHDAAYSRLTIVGIVKNVMTFGFSAPPPPTIYVPFESAPTTLTSTAIRHFHLFVRVQRNASAYVKGIENTIHAASPDVSITTIRPLAEIVRSYFAPRRIISDILAALAISALTLATLGIYAIASVSVLSKQTAWAVRLAVGATRFQIVALALKEGFMLVLLGLCAGLILGWISSDAVRQLLTFSVTQIHADTAAAAALGTLLLSIVSVIASIIPALVASRSEPARILLNGAQ